MALIIPNYLEPGAYSTLVIAPTTVSSSGVPIVAIVGQALQGPYTPQLFYNADDAQTMYGNATKANPLPLGIQIAFENGAPQVLGLNVEPTNSQLAYLTSGNTGLPGIVICTQGSNTSSFPASAYAPAVSSLLDPITNQPVNSNGTVAGVFYIQDFNPTVADPVLNATPVATATAFANAGTTNLLQFIKYGAAPTLNGIQQVPFSNSANMFSVTVPANHLTAPPATSAYQSGVFGVITQPEWTQFQNALTILTAINSTPNCPVAAQILVPDANQTVLNPVIGWREMYSAVGNNNISYNTSTVAITSNADAFAYACQAGVLYIAAQGAGSEHEIVMGLFAASTFGPSGLQPFGLPTAFAGPNNTNPYIIFDNGVDGVVTTTSYINAINNQLTAVRADMVVVLNTDSTLQNTIKSHVTTMSSSVERNERIALVSGPISEVYTTSIANAQALQGGPGAERMVYVWPTGGYRADPILHAMTTLDGTYLAAACAGILASNDAATPLTRKVLAGFSDIITKTTRSAMNLIAQNGVCVIENNPTQGLRVRDGITCDPTSVESQEISVVRQLDFTAQTVRDLLDLHIVATKISPNTLAVVQTMTTNQLQLLVGANIIYAFASVSARIDPIDPRQIDVRFSIRPAYPCKYIQITINVTSDLTGF